MSSRILPDPCAVSGWPCMQGYIPGKTEKVPPSNPERDFPRIVTAGPFQKIALFKKTASLQIWAQVLCHYQPTAEMTLTSALDRVSVVSTKVSTSTRLS